MQRHQMNDVNQWTFKDTFVTFYHLIHDKTISSSAAKAVEGKTLFLLKSCSKITAVCGLMIATLTRLVTR